MNKTYHLTNEQLLTHPDLAQLSEEHNRSFLAHVRTALFLLILVLGFVVAYFHSYSLNSLSTIPILERILMSFAFSLTLGVGSALFIHSAFVNGDLFQHSARLTSLRRIGIESCKEALNLAQNREQCQKHVDQALKDGREILLLDLWHMRVLAKKHDPRIAYAKKHFGEALTPEQKKEVTLLKFKILGVCLLTIAAFYLSTLFQPSNEYLLKEIILLVVFMAALAFIAYIGGEIERSKPVWAYEYALPSIQELMEEGVSLECITSLRKQNRTISLSDFNKAMSLNRKPRNACRELHGIQA